MKKIGIMGGTFNPIHNAHLALARNAYKQYKLDEVVFLPSKNPPHKPKKEIASDDARVKMIELSIEEQEYFSISKMELEREGTTFTVDTLEELKMNSDDELYFIIGGDSLFSFDKWRNPKRILELCNLVACGRDNKQKNDVLHKIDELEEIYGGNILYLEVEPLDISSSQIRMLADQKASLKDYVPRRVEDYIYENKLYDNTND